MMTNGKSTVHQLIYNNYKRYCYKDFYFLFDSKGKFYKVVEKG